MGKSYKKNAYGGWTGAESEKKDKETAHRAFRNKSKQALKHFVDTEVEDFPEKLREVSEEWTFAKDGRQYCGEPKENDPDYERKLENHKKIKRK